MSCGEDGFKLCHDQALYSQPNPTAATTGIDAHYVTPLPPNVQNSKLIVETIAAEPGTFT